MPNIYTEEGYLQKQPDFLDLEEGSVTNPSSHVTSGPECCINLSHGDGIPWRSQASKSNLSSVQRPSKEMFSTSTTYLNFGSTDTILSLVQSSSAWNRPSRSNEKSHKFQVNDDKLQLNQSKAINAINWKHYYNLSFEKNNKVEHRVMVHSQRLTSQATSNIITSDTAATNKKKRMRWTEGLHNQFVECVNCLGGVNGATPMSIHKLMNREGLTIFHIKSHLQKYRAAQYQPTSNKGTNAKTDMGSMAGLDLKMGTQITKALRKQIDVLRSLYEQLECQKNLQLQIEEQAKQVKEIFITKYWKQLEIYDP